jgi:hypothetical protein
MTLLHMTIVWSLKKLHAGRSERRYQPPCPDPQYHCGAREVQVLQVSASLQGTQIGIGALSEFC